MIYHVCDLVESIPEIRIFFLKYKSIKILKYLNLLIKIIKILIFKYNFGIKFSLIKYMYKSIPIKKYFFLLISYT